MIAGLEAFITSGKFIGSHDGYLDGKHSVHLSLDAMMMGGEIAGILIACKLFAVITSGSET
jgi:hypothetical protein